MKKIGLLIISTNKYISFLQQLVDSADRFFLPNHDVKYFIFSNLDFELKTNREFCVTKIEHKPWPRMTLDRYKIFSENSDLFDDIDYLFYCDVDMRFVDVVGDEILSERVATTHPGFNGGRGTPETNPESLAYIGNDENLHYFAGGFNGGSTEEFIRMSSIINQNIEQDLQKNIIAIWHDESHMNRFFLDYPPTKILTPSYCYPENWLLSFTPKILALFKTYSDFRD
jgi:histo-blood group ABO system transferase